jgi:hypothetical protein
MFDSDARFPLPALSWGSSERRKWTMARTGNGTTVRACNQALSHCITGKMVRRSRGSGKCSQCQLAVMAAFFRT